MFLCSRANDQKAAVMIYLFFTASMKNSLFAAVHSANCGISFARIFRYCVLFTTVNLAVACYASCRKRHQIMCLWNSLSTSMEQLDLCVAFVPFAVASFLQITSSFQTH